MESPVPLKGWQKYFNSYTTAGRRNVVIAFYTTTFLGVYLLMKWRRSKKAKQAIKET